MAISLAGCWIVSYYPTFPNRDIAQQEQRNLKATCSYSVRMRNHFLSSLSNSDFSETHRVIYVTPVTCVGRVCYFLVIVLVCW